MSANDTSVLRGLFDALNARKADRAARQLAAEYRGLDATRSAVTVGRENARAEIQAGLDAFSPTFSVQQRVADPPHVFVFWRMEGVHEGPFLQIPATHRAVDLGGASLFTIRDGQITRGLHLWDLAGLLRTVGLLPDLPGTANGADASLDAPLFETE